MRFLIKFSYDGTAFAGFQKQRGDGLQILHPLRDGRLQQAEGWGRSGSAALSPERPPPLPPGFRLPELRDEGGAVGCFLLN